MGLRQFLSRGQNASGNEAKAVEETRQVIAETEETKRQLRSLVKELSDYVVDLRVLTTALAVRKNEGTHP